jgi:hypothetical protein
MSFNIYDLQLSDDEARAVRDRLNLVYPPIDKKVGPWRVKQGRTGWSVIRDGECAGMYLHTEWLADLVADVMNGRRES